VTLILGVEDPQNHRAILCCDSGAWKGDQIDSLRTPKIWRQDSWLVGLAGGWAQSQRARLVYLPDPKSESREDIEAAIVRWSDELLDSLGQLAERIRRVEPDEKTQGPGIVVARGPWVWDVCDGGVVNSERGMNATGVADYAVAAHAALTGVGFSGEELAWGICRAVAKVTKSVEAPFRWMSTTGASGTWNSVTERGEP
jgi:hypothetical protein